MALIEKLQAILTSKNAVKEALVTKLGAEAVTDQFSTYAGLINGIVPQAVLENAQVMFNGAEALQTETLDATHAAVLVGGKIQIVTIESLKSAESNVADEISGEPSI